MCFVCSVTRKSLWIGWKMRTLGILLLCQFFSMFDAFTTFFPRPKMHLSFTIGQCLFLNPGCCQMPIRKEFYNCTTPTQIFKHKSTDFAPSKPDKNWQKMFVGEVRRSTELLYSTAKYLHNVCLLTLSCALLFTNKSMGQCIDGAMLTFYQSCVHK